MTEELKARIAQINAGTAPAGYKKTKVGIVPEEWEVTRFASISQKTGSERNDSDCVYPVYSINNKTGFAPQGDQFENDGYSNTSKDLYRIVRKGEFAYNPARINVGSIGLLSDVDAVIISSLYVCFKLNDKCYNPYFWQYFKSHRFNFDVNNYTEGSVREYLFYDNFARIRIAVPPLPEQQKIAEILTAQDAVIALMQKQIELKQQQKKYLMQKLLSGEVRVGSGEWKKVKLGALCTFIRNGFTYTPSTPELGAKITRIETISDRMINLNNVGYAIRPIDNKYRLQKGDILFSHINSLSQIGKTALFNLDDELYHGMNLLCIRANEEVIPLFLFLLLNSQKANAYYKAYAKKAINQCSISASELTKMTFIIPSLPEQVKIAEILSAQDKEIELLQQQLALEQQKKKALMQLLLTGKVRVKT